MPTESNDHGPVSTLRGAGVGVDARRVGRVVAALCLASLSIVAVVLFVAGAQKNAQIDELRANGVPITVTVTRCMGLLGGSGSNAAGYACRGTYTFGGHRYDEAIPGNVNLAPRSTLPAIISPGDPALVSTVAAVRNSHSSWRVFIVPVALTLIVGVITLILVMRRNTPRRGSDPVAPEGLPGGDPKLEEAPARS